MTRDKKHQTQTVTQWSYISTNRSQHLYHTNLKPQGLSPFELYERAGLGQTQLILSTATESDKWQLK